LIRRCVQRSVGQTTMDTGSGQVLPLGPGRKSDKYAKNDDDMMDILVDNINRHEVMTEREELIALASVLSGEATIHEQIDTGHVENLDHDCDDAMKNDKNENMGRYKNKSMADTDQFIQDNKNKMYKMKSDLKMFYEWSIANGELRMVEDISFNE